MSGLSMTLDVGVAVNGWWKAGNSFIRVARKAWRCQCHVRLVHGQDDEGRGLRCDVTIQPGQVYVESVDSSPAYQSGDRYCWTCAHEQGLIAEEQPIRHLQSCRLTYVDQTRIDARTCRCGGRLDDYYEWVQA